MSQEYELICEDLKSPDVEVEVDDESGERFARNIRGVAVPVVDIEEYETGDGWRWRLKDPGNHQNLVPAGQGFHDRQESRENFRRVYRLIGGTCAVRWVEVKK